MGACSAIYVQKLRDGKYHVWHGSTQVDEPPAKPGEWRHVGAFDARGDALCAAHDAEGFSRTSDGVIELQDEAPATTVSACQQCECPFFERSRQATADPHRPWRDADGAWYDGPARETITLRCRACGWSQLITRERGKTIKVATIKVEHPNG
jgi:hypothetical protein